MLKQIQDAIAALRAVPKEHRALVLAEVEYGGRGRRRKPGPKKGSKKPGPKPKQAAAKAAPAREAKEAKDAPVAKPKSGPVKVSSAKAAKLAKLRGQAAEAEA